MSKYAKPTQEMLDHFKQRTKEHIDRVVKYMGVLEGFEGLDVAELQERAQQHDRDKYSKELVLPYLWVTEYHRVNNEEGSVPDDLQKQYDLASEATGKHVEQNRHHPEAHEALSDLTNLDLAEMVADWSAMAEELDEGSCRGWADKNIGSKWKFSPEQEEFIYGCIDWLEDAMSQQRTASDYGTPCNDARTCPGQVPDSWDREELLSEFDDLLDIQCSKGNWDYDPYLHGMANGMILLRSIVSGEEPNFLEAPDQWGDDELVYHHGAVEVSLDAFDSETQQLIAMWLKKSGEQPGTPEYEQYKKKLVDRVLMLNEQSPDKRINADTLDYHRGFVAARYIAAYTMQTSQEELWDEYEAIVSEMETLSQRYQQGRLSARQYDIEMDQLEQMLREIEDEIL